MRVESELLRSVEQFLFHEARLLDQQRWDEWLDLFTPDGVYWVPLAHGQTDASNHASLFYEDAFLRAMRAKRLQEARVFSQQPPGHAVRMVSNIDVESAVGSATVARSNLLMLEWRKSEQRIVGGHVTHELALLDDQIRIRLKRVDLINCDAPHESLQFFI